MTLSTAELRRLWGPDCAESTELRTIALWSGARVTINALCVDAFQALDRVMKSHNYLQRRADTGAMNCRPITGGSGYSLHAFGIAQDTNWTTNPYGPRLVTDRSQAMVDDIYRIRTNNNKQVFRWGGYYTGQKDAMHDEVVVSPADIRTGINWHTVNQGNNPIPTPHPTLPEDDMRLIEVTAGDDKGKVFYVVGNYRNQQDKTSADRLIKSGVPYIMQDDIAWEQTAFLTRLGSPPALSG